MTTGERSQVESSEAGGTSVQEILLNPEPVTDTRSTLAVFALGVLLVIALLGGAYLVAGDDTTDIDIAANEDSVETVTTLAPESDDDREPAPPTTVARAPAVGSFERGAAGDSAIFGGGPGGIVATEDGFVSVGWGPEGQVIEMSSDGLEWVSTPVEGLPGDGGLTMLAEHEGTFVAIYEEWPTFDERDEDDVSAYFGPEESPKQFVASSSDLETWTLVPFPDFGADSDHPVYVSISGLAVGDEGIAVLADVYPEGPNEMRVLFDNGVIDESDLESFCGTEFDGRDEPIVVYSCDFAAMEERYEDFERAMEEAGTEEERQTIERDFEAGLEEPEQTALASIDPGTPLHDKLSDVYEYDLGQDPARIVVGPVVGPFAVAQLPETGHASGVVAVGDGFLAMLSSFERADEATNVFGSADGRDWSVVGALETQNVNSVSVVGSTVVVVGNGTRDDFSAKAWSSEDSGATWTESDLGAMLYGSWANAVSGPAGVAVVVTGSPEPIAEPEPYVIDVEKDGFVLTVGLERGAVRLTGPDGTTIYELNEEDLYGSEDGRIDGILRTEGRFDSVHVFLDPETGADLVTFTEEDWLFAYENVDFGVSELEQEPEFVAQAYFSGNGVDWSPVEIDLGSGFEGGTELVAVGDDEILFVEYSWVEPPTELFAFEEEGRDPTDEEMERLDEWFEANDGGGSSEWIRVPIV